MSTDMRRFVVRCGAVVVAIVVLTAVQLFHGSGLPAYETLWAEDGSRFLQGALEHRSIFETHAGYGQVAPRLVGWGAAQISLDDAALWFAIVSSVVTALLALAVFWLSDFVVRPWLLRAVIALSFVLPAVLVPESLANAANLQWPFLAACFWALARPTKGWRDGAVCGAILVVTALSSSVAFVYLPLAALVVALRRRRAACIVPAVFAVACAAQAWLALSAPESATQGASSFFDLPALYSVRVAGSAALGDRLLISSWVHVGIATGIVIGVLAVMAIGVLFVKNDHEGRLWGGAAIVMSLVVFCATTYYRGTEVLRLPDGKWNLSGSRYAGCALQLLVAGVVVLVARAQLARRWQRALVWVVAAQAIVAPAISLRPETARSHGVKWRPELAAGRRVCRQTRLPDVFILITPDPRLWQVDIDCSLLR
jgi:hypothetical protein